MERSSFAACGHGTVIEPGAMVLRPDAVHLGPNVTIESFALLVGDPQGELRVGDGSLVGPHAYLQGLGGLQIGRRVGVGAGVLMLTAVHAETPPGGAIMDAPLRYGRIEIGDGCDIGVGAILLPGARLGAGVQVGAGAVVRGHHSDGTVVAGVPARVLRMRGEGDWAGGLATRPPGRR